MMKQEPRTIRKICRTCKKTIRWVIIPDHPELGYFTDDNTLDQSKRHYCPGDREPVLASKSNGNRKVEELLLISSKDFEEGMQSISNQFKSTQKALNSLQNLILELKAKLNAVLRGSG